MVRVSVSANRVSAKRVSTKRVSANRDWTHYYYYASLAWTRAAGSHTSSTTPRTIWPVWPRRYRLRVICERVSVNTTSAPSATRLCRLPQQARNWPSMYSFFAQKWYGLLSFWALSWLRARILTWAVVWRLSLAVVVFLYEITVFYNQTWKYITTSLLELYFNDSMQTVRARQRRWWQSRKRGRRWGRCSIYRHRMRNVKLRKGNLWNWLRNALWLVGGN